GRQVVADPIAALGDDLCLGRADLLLQLAQRRGARVLAFVDAALRHLPSLGTLVDAAADEDEVVIVDQQDTDAWSIRALLVRQGLAHSLCLFTTAETGASTMPLATSVGAQLAMRSIVTG